MSLDHYADEQALRQRMLRDRTRVAFDVPLPLPDACARLPVCPRSMLPVFDVYEYASPPPVAPPDQAALERRLWFEIRENEARANAMSARLRGPLLAYPQEETLTFSGTRRVVVPPWFAEQMDALHSLPPEPPHGLIALQPKVNYLYL